MSDNFDPVPNLSEDKEPWWNNKDRVGGLVATVVTLTVLALIVALVVKFIIWLF